MGVVGRDPSGRKQQVLEGLRACQNVWPLTCSLCLVGKAVEITDNRIQFVDNRFKIATGTWVRENEKV
jgi:hypothetical protein